MCSVPEDCLKARFRWNRSNPLQEDSSSLVYALKDAEWVPQGKGDSNISYVKPCEAFVERLPNGFPYETGQKWFEEIEFGTAAKEKRLENIRKEFKENQKNQNAKEFGFGSADEAKNAVEFFIKERGHLQRSHSKNFRFKNDVRNY